MDNINYWPYTNIHELNLDWIISKVKELDTRFTDDIETFVRDYIDEHFAEWTVNANYDPDDETIIYTNGTGATLTAGDVIRFAIDNAYVNVKDPTARTAASNAATAAAAAQGTANNNTSAIAALDTAYKAADTAINNKIGSGTLTTAAQTLIGAVNELNSERLYQHIFTATTTAGGYVQIPNFTTERIIPVYVAVQNTDTESWAYYAVPYGTIFYPWLKIFTEAGAAAASINVSITVYHFRNLRILED